MTTTIHDARSRPIGSPSSFIRRAERAEREGVAEVPCAGCNSCCRSGLVVDLTAEEAARLPHWTADNGTRFLPKPDGRTCLMLVDGKCSIYANRPRACRIFDCRWYVFLNFKSNDETMQREGVEQWMAPKIATVDDRLILLALQMASRAGGHVIGIAHAWAHARRWRDFISLAREMMRCER